VLTAAIRTVLAASPFHGEGHRKVWARLRMKGMRRRLDEAHPRTALCRRNKSQPRSRVQIS
jgi:hypothetical protein